MRKIMIALVSFGILATPAMAKPPLNQVAAIDDALFDLGIADRIRKNCPTINARMFRAFSYVRKLESDAKALGYSSAEIEAYTDSEADKARLRAKAVAFFKAKGVDTSDPQSYCTFGRAEIQKSSRIGSLLKAK
ncbi:MAG: DUF5333 domain-containing protein [Sulfitobacter sp.]